MKKRDLHYVCFWYTLDRTEYLDDMGVSMPSKELFRRMSDGAQTKTSQVSVEEYIAHFERMLAEGLDACATVRERDACKHRLLEVMERSVEEFHRRGWPICIEAAGAS